MSFEKWDAALSALLKTDDGADLAYLLRRVQTVRTGRYGLVPMRILREVAELLDPQISWNPQTIHRTRLGPKAVTEVQRVRLDRRQKLIGLMLLAIEEGMSIQDAADSVGEKLGITGRQVLTDWAKARRSMPMLASVRAKKKPAGSRRSLK